MSVPRTVLLIGTFDTKGEEYAFVRDVVLARGHRVLTLDVGVLGADGALPVDIDATETARAGGAELGALRATRDRGQAVAAMTAGACALTRDLFRQQRFDGVLGLGGGGGTSIITAAMRELPLGVPKLMVSTMASGNTTPYVDVKDIAMLYPVVDIAGLNPISRRVLANAAHAISGMVEGGDTPESGAPARPLIAATMFGVTTPCVTAARRRLEAAGYDVLVFHATGSGGRAMEALIADGWFAGVLDLTTTEWCDEVAGGVLSAGPDRLGAAARAGVPQVVSTGALDMVNFGPRADVPARFAGRLFYEHNATVTLMRTTPEECAEIGRRIAGHLAAATAPAVLLLPLGGVSALDALDKPFHSPEANAALFEALRTHLLAAANPHVHVRELDLHINDEVFAHAAADALLALLSARPVHLSS